MIGEEKKHIITLLPSGVVFESLPEKTILDSALDAGIVLEHSCKTGSCGACEAKIVTSENHQVDNSDLLTCQVKASCNMTLEADYFPELADIKCLTVPAKVNRILHHSSDIMVLELRLPPKNIFNFLPGQYIDLKYNGVVRSYSIASIPNAKNTLELHFKKVSDGAMSSKIFSPVPEGQLLQIEGPKGSFFFRDTKTGPIIFLATGTGFAPVKAIVSKLIYDEKLNRPIYIYWGNRHSELFYDDSPLDLAKKFENIHISLCLSREESGWVGRSGYIQDCLLSDGVSLIDAEVYACGSMDMINKSREALIESGLDKSSFYSDAFVAS